MTATTTPRRITTVQYVKASIAVAFGWEPEHPGATPEWAAQLRQGLTGPPAPTATPQPAIAAAPYREVVDEHLGVLRIASQEPARLHDALARARNLPSLLDLKDPA